jgi:VIT1/CCC1 family predicted Fe2+/Mn2+ transporter
MSKRPWHSEHHRVARLGWLRAGVLGANDGIVSTASLMVAVAAANADQKTILVSGVAGLVAGAMSMAAGEYVSVSSQADTEKADLEMESREIKLNPVYETEELAQIYVQRGLDLSLAREVAAQLMARDPLKSHARDELGITETGQARPTLAALSSGLSFAAGAFLPLLVTQFFTGRPLIWAVGITTLIALISLGIVSARIGGAPVMRAIFRVAFWGAFALGISALIGNLFHLGVSL